RLPGWRGGSDRLDEDRERRADLGAQVFVRYRTDDLGQRCDAFLVRLDHAVSLAKLRVLEPGDRGVGLRPADPVHLQERHGAAGGPLDRHLVERILNRADIVGPVTGFRALTDRLA